MKRGNYKKHASSLHSGICANPMKPKRCDKGFALYYAHRFALLARTHAHTCQGFCVLCFHNLHTRMCSPPFSLLEIRELLSKNIGDFPEVLRHFCETLLEAYQNL